MKKALLLAGLFLCATAAYAEEIRIDKIADGRKRNEEVYERMLEETGWKKESASQSRKDTQPAPHQTPAARTHPKSS